MQISNVDADGISNSFRVSAKTLAILAGALLCFSALNPYYLWGVGKEVQVVLVFLFSALVFSERYFLKGSIFKGAFLAVLIALFGFLYGMSVVGSLYVACFVFVLVNIGGAATIKMYNLFKIFFVMSMVPGLLLWVVHNILLDKHFLFSGYVDSALVPNQLKVEAGHSYAKFPMSVVLNYMLDWPYYRLLGPFDEPGRVGTVAGLLLALERCKLKSITNIALLLIGVLTFSFAFYVMLLIYFIVRYIKNPVAIISVVLVAVMVGGALSQNDFFKSKIVDRFGVSSEGGFAGDNRTGISLENNFTSWQRTSGKSFLLGLENISGDEGSSWKLIPIRSGLVGVCLFLIFFGGVYLLNNGLRLPKNLAFLVVFFSSVYQRPDVISPALILIFFAGTFVYAKKNPHAL